MRVPTANQKLFDSVKMFSRTLLSGLQGCGLYHSYGLNRARTYIIRLTTRYAAITYTQISIARGLRKENRPGLSLRGRWRKEDKKRKQME